MQVEHRRDPRPHRGHVLPVLGVEAVAQLHLHQGQRQRHGVQRRADVVGQGGDQVVAAALSHGHLRILGGGVGEDRLLHRTEQDGVDGAGLGVPRPGPQHLGGEGPDRLLEQGVLPQQGGQADPLPLAGGGVLPGLGHHRGRRLPFEAPDQPVEEQREVAGQVGVGEPLGLGGLPADGQHPEPQHVVAVGHQDVGQGHRGSCSVFIVRPTRFVSSPRMASGVRRLDQMVIEARLPGPRHVGLLAPAGQRHDQRPPGTRAAPAAAWPPRCRPSPAARCPAGRPRGGTPRPRPGPPGRRGRPAPPARTASPAAGPGSWRRPRCRPPPGCGGGAACRPAPRRSVPRPVARSARAAARTGQPDDELAALARPVAARRDRAAVHLDERPHQAQADPQPALGVAPVLPDLDEHVEDPGQHLGPRSRCPCPAPARPTSPPSGSTASRIWPPGSVYLAELFSRFQRTCSSLVGSASSRIAPSGRATVSSVAALVDQGPGRLDGLADDRGQVHDLLLEFDLAPADAGHVHQVVDQAGQVDDLPLGHRPLGLEALAVAPGPLHQVQGVADRGQGVPQVRGPASPGTRPCGGRPPAAPPPTRFRLVMSVQAPTR